MDRPGDANLRTWTLLWMALLAADAHDQLAWLGERELESSDVLEEVQLRCRAPCGRVRATTEHPRPPYTIVM
ncbi:hypothetical protein [Streptomyces sp. NPDC046925]|uniref:hypothetical protein n=1 Tax=Streptomyces sp. NPDC046925 TaxID=3155375 RepID=UPI0033DAD9B5